MTTQIGYFDGTPTFVAVDATHGLPIQQVGATPAGTNLIGITQVTAGGGSKYAFNGAATTNSTVARAFPASIANISVYNGTGAAMFLKMYDKATAPTVGTDIPIDVWPLAIGEKFVASFGTGLRFTAGIAFATTALGTDTDTTAIALGLKIHLTYS